MKYHCLENGGLAAHSFLVKNCLKFPGEKKIVGEIEMGAPCDFSADSPEGEVLFLYARTEAEPTGLSDRKCRIAKSVSGDSP